MRGLPPSAGGRRSSRRRASKGRALKGRGTRYTGEERDTRPPPPGRRPRARAATAAAGAPRRLAPRTRGRACALTARARASASFCRARTRTWKTRRSIRRARTRARRRRRGGVGGTRPARTGAGPRRPDGGVDAAARCAPSRAPRVAFRAQSRRRRAHRAAPRARCCGEAPRDGDPGESRRPAGRRARALRAPRRSARARSPQRKSPRRRKGPTPRRRRFRSAPAEPASVGARRGGCGDGRRRRAPRRRFAGGARSSEGREVFFSRVAPSAGVSVRGDSAGERRSERRSAGDEARDARVVAAQRGRVEGRGRDAWPCRVGFLFLFFSEKRKSVESNRGEGRVHGFTTTGDDRSLVPRLCLPFSPKKEPSGHRASSSPLARREGERLVTFSSWRSR